MPAKRGPALRLGIVLFISGIVCLMVPAPTRASEPLARPPIFPAPRQLTATADTFTLDESVSIVVPARPSEQDLFLAKSLARELSDRFDVQLKIVKVASLPVGRRVIVMGTAANPIVRAFGARNGQQVTASAPGAEGYVLSVDANAVVVAGSDDRGAFYGLQSLRQLAARVAGKVQFPGVKVRDWPDKPFRGIKLYLPGRRNIPYFKRFVRDFMALYKYNTLIMEMNASMRLDSHPELNTGWVEFARDTNYSRRNYPPGNPHEIEQNSSHQDTGDGGFLEKEEVLDLARFVRANHIELILEIPSFTHSYYLLSKHPELSEVPGEKWPDTYCPSNPQSYQLLFEVMDEYIDLLHPRMVHIGHDEMFVPVGLCPRCHGKDAGELYGEDVKKIHDHLAAKGVKTAMWGDMLLESVRKKGLQKKKTDSGWEYLAPGAMTPGQVDRLIPRDILIFNWFWHGEEGEMSEERAERNEAQLDRMGFQQIYGNFNPDIANYKKRSRRATILGGAPSAWFATNEYNFGKNMLSDSLGCIDILWSGQTPGGAEVSGITQALIPEVRQRLSGIAPPSLTETTAAPVNIARSFNWDGVDEALGLNFEGMRAPERQVPAASVPFEFANDGPKVAVIAGTQGRKPGRLSTEAPAIGIGQDATSVIFLHAAARRATNKEAFRVIWDMEDTADMLGLYEVVYEDGFVTTIPIRYGVNIMEWNWSDRKSAGAYAYNADPVAATDGGGHPITFWAYEWINPRLGKTIKEVRLKGTSGFRGGDPGFTNDWGPVIETNAVILKAITVVKKR